MRFSRLPQPLKVGSLPLESTKMIQLFSMNNNAALTWPTMVRSHSILDTYCTPLPSFHCLPTTPCTKRVCIQRECFLHMRLSFSKAKQPL